MPPAGRGLSSCRPVVDGPESGAVFPGGRPVDGIDGIDGIDRIDGIDEVGRRVQCTMQNAQCTMGEGAARRQAGAGGAAAERPPNLQS